MNAEIEKVLGEIKAIKTEMSYIREDIGDLKRGMGSRVENYGERIVSIETSYEGIKKQMKDQDEKINIIEKNRWKWLAAHGTILATFLKIFGIGKG